MALLPKTSFAFTLYLQGTCTQFSNHFCYCFSLFNFRMTSDGSGSSFDQPFVIEYLTVYDKTSTCMSHEFQDEKEKNKRQRRKCFE